MGTSSPSLTPPNENALGNFISVDLWQDALKLLDLQVKQRQTNKHFNTLSMLYYDKLGSAVEALRNPGYFHAKIASGLFFGLENEFRSYPYTVPKSVFRVRPYLFLSYPLRAVYYAVVLYLLKLTDDYQTRLRQRKLKRIHAFYGGRLALQRGRLNIGPETIYYLEYYKAFRRVVKQTIGKAPVNTIVLRFDIQDYFESIPVRSLLNYLRRKIKDSVQKKLHFDGNAENEILSVFRLIMGEPRGIPQTDNDIVSGFIGWLYLSFFDQEIEDQLGALPEVANYQVIRYVDDYFVFLTFKDGIDRKVMEEVAVAILGKLGDTLFHKFDLKINAKLKVSRLYEPGEANELLALLKRVSENFLDAGGDEKIQPATKVARIFNALSELKGSSLVQIARQDQFLQDEILKDVFDKRVGQLLSRRQNIAIIERIFEDFNFDLVRVHPREVILILLRSFVVAAAFRDFLLAKRSWGTSDFDLAVRYLCQTDFTDVELAQRVASAPRFGRIIASILNPSLELGLPGYFRIEGSKIAQLADYPAVVEQIRLRVLSEREDSYSLALNHLTNELQAICFANDRGSGKDPKDYDVNDVVSFLEGLGAPNSIIGDVEKLFDRRNVNQISHSGSEGSVVWGVVKDEYEEYRAGVGNCLALIL